MSVLFEGIIFVWWLRIIANAATYIQLWYIKEYRADRMLIHLKTEEGRNVLWTRFRRPRISPKTILLGLSTAATLYALYFFSPLPVIFRLLVIDCLTFPVVSLFVLMGQLPTSLYHKMIIARATQTLRRHAPMTVIGITGSFGKTTTKEYLAAILSTKFHVLKTEASKNSPIGIAEVILQKLTPKHEIFIVEMGAYKIGEITEMVAMVKPQIGIVTAISAQHQDLFGTLENTMNAKYELIAGLEGKRIAIMNVGDVRVRTMAEWAKRDGLEVWAIAAQAPAAKTFLASGIKATFEGIEFICASGKEKVRVKAPVIGAHQATNVVAAIAGAVAAGMSFRDAALAARSVVPNPRSLSVIPGINGSTYINDTFNNSLESAIAALDVLSWAKGKKYLIFQPMIELGEFGERSHREVGEAAGKICDDIILTNKNFFGAFMGGVTKSGTSASVQVLTPAKAAQYIRKHIRAEDTVLFKGKEAESTLRILV